MKKSSCEIWKKNKKQKKNTSVNETWEKQENPPEIFIFITLECAHPKRLKAGTPKKNQLNCGNLYKEKTRMFSFLTVGKSGLKL